MALPTFAAPISIILEIEAKTDRSGQQPEEYHFGESQSNMLFLAQRTGE